MMHLVNSNIRNKDSPDDVHACLLYIYIESDSYPLFFIFLLFRFLKACESMCAKKHLCQRNDVRRQLVIMCVGSAGYRNSNWNRQQQ